MAKPYFCRVCSTVLACMSLVMGPAGLLQAAENERAHKTDSSSDQRAVREAEKTLPDIQAQILFVKRDWSNRDDAKPIRKELLDAAKNENLADEIKQKLELKLDLKPADEDADLLSVGAFLPKAGHAAIFKKEDFASLHQWLRERRLLVDEKEIPLEPTRFEERFTARFEPIVNHRAAADQIWILQLDIFRSEDPVFAGRLKIRRVHNRRSPANGPRLRGAAVDIRKEVSFFLPHDRIVAMSWYAHPNDLGLLPTVDQRIVEPILVFEEKADAEKQQPKEPTATFRFPERVVDLMVD